MQSTQPHQESVSRSSFTQLYGSPCWAKAWPRLFHRSVQSRGVPFSQVNQITVNLHLETLDAFACLHHIIGRFPEYIHCMCQMWTHTGLLLPLQSKPPWKHLLQQGLNIFWESSWFRERVNCFVCYPGKRIDGYQLRNQGRERTCSHP